MLLDIVGCIICQKGKEEEIFCNYSFSSPPSPQFYISAFAVDGNNNDVGDNDGAGKRCDTR